MTAKGREQRLRKRLSEWVDEHHFKTVEDTKKMYRYAGGVYLSDGETFLESLIEKEFHSITSEALIRDMIGKVKRMTYVKHQEFNNKPFINVKNGLLDLQTFELMPHTPDHISTYQMPFPFDPDADCPNNRAFFGQVAKGEDLTFIKELFGWVLWPEYHIHKAVMLVGCGRNGKGTFLRVLSAFLGHENISNIPIQDLASDRFAGSDLFGKSANIGGDLPAKDLSDTALFKMLTGEDATRVQEKYRKAFNFKNRAKMFFSANRLPMTSDDTYGFFSRWWLLEFNNVFDPSKGTGDPNLLAKLTTEEELSGLLNMALNALQRLRANGWQFSYTKTVEEVETMYKRLSNPVVAFLLDECEASEHRYIDKIVFQSRFNEYCQKHGIPPLNSSRFGRLLKEQSEIPLSDYRPWRAGEERPRCWLGVRFKQDDIPTDGIGSPDVDMKPGAMAEA